jgi:hypothetical protein
LTDWTWSSGSLEDTVEKYAVEKQAVDVPVG